MKNDEIRAMNDEQLQGAESNLRQGLFEARMAKATGELADKMRLGVLRRDLARVLTAQQERALASKREQ